MKSLNYFAHSSAAQRYARGRPYFHPLAMERISSICGIQRRVEWGLDVACGTGQSTVALAELAQKVIGADISSEMLSQSTPHLRARYVRASAELLPFASGVFELLTVALAFHWLDRLNFLREAMRVVRAGGWLVIYNDGFSGSMNGNAPYERWNSQSYLARYPTPPRRSEPLSDAEAESFGFEFAGRGKFTHDVTFSPMQLVSYLLTQSNTISAIEQGREEVAEVARWLMESVEPMFEGKEQGTFPFRCDIHAFRRMASKVETCGEW